MLPSLHPKLLISKKLRGGLLCAATFVFIAFYFYELNPDHEWPPWHYRFLVSVFGKYSLLTLNIIMLMCFTFGLCFRCTTRLVWAAHGLVLGFMISILTEMFGVPLAVFLLWPFVHIHPIGELYLLTFGGWPIAIGVLVNFIALVILTKSWFDLHSSKDDLVTTGLYGRVRHPQYLALTMFTFGWLLHWPAMVTLAIWPFLATAYVWAGRAEERALAREFGSKFYNYKSVTGFYVPRVFSKGSAIGGAGEAPS